MSEKEPIVTKPGSVEPKHDPYGSLRVKSFRIYVIAFLLTQIGFQIQAAAIGWEVYQRTNDALALGLVGLIQALPMLLFTLPAGYLADVFSRKWIVALSALGAVLTALGLALASHQTTSIAVFYLLLFIDAAAVTLARPASSALVPLLVPRDRFENAVSWRVGAVQVSMMVGPVLGGYLAKRSLPLTYLANACVALVALLLLLWIRVERVERSGDTPSLRAILVGVRFIWEKRLLLSMISLDLFAVLLGGSISLLPMFAEDILLVDARGYGWLRAAPAIGAFCMSLVLTHRPPMRRAGRSLLLAVTGYGVATAIFGLSTVYWLSWIMLFLTGVFDNVSMVIRHTMQQVLTPDAMRGRVSAVTTVFIGSSNELGTFESGLVARWFSPVVSMVSGGVATLLVVAVTAVASPALRRFGAIKDDAG